jgi:hypothetical protein
VFAASHLRRSLSEQAPTKKEPVITTSSSAFELCPDGLARLCGCFLFQKLFRLFNLLLIAGKFLLVSLLDFIIRHFLFSEFLLFHHNPHRRWVSSFGLRTRVDPICIAIPKGSLNIARI